MSLNKLIIISLFFYACDTSLSADIYIRTNKHYGNEVWQQALKFNLPPEYLKALIILECSGLKNVPSRFEKHVYKKLKRVQAGTLSNYENITRNDLKDAKDSAIKNLASSWGPFQIMGYKCIKLNTNVKSLRGNDAIYWGVKWINNEYGEYLRNNKFEEAFRIHNTGSPNGKTHDPDYVKNGLKHLKNFKTN